MKIIPLVLCPPLFCSRHLFLTVFLPVLFLAHGWAASSAPIPLTPEEKAWLKAHPEWQTAGSASPPFVWVDEDGQLQGMSADFAELLEDRLGIKFKPTPADSWTQSLKQLQTGGCDVSLLTSQSADRDGYLVFTDEILRLPTVIITREDNRGIESFEDLRGKTVTVAKDWPIHEKLVREHSDIRLTPHEDPAGALADVALGGADAFIGDLASASHAIERAGMTNLRIAAQAPFAFPFRIAVRKDWPEAVGILNKAIKTLSEEERATIRRKWMAVRDNGMSWREILRVAVPAGFILLVALLAIANWRLKQAVAQQTEDLSEALDKLSHQNTFLDAEVARRTREMENVKDATVLALAGLAETRDCETGAHLRRTQLYVQTLAEAARRLPKFREELTEETIRLLVKTAPLHDIGKVGIPDHILLKPGKLTPEEFEIMKQHATLGGKALAEAERQIGSSSGFLRQAREIATTHHEKWDGSGYPLGLKGEAIPLSGRIMAIADVYDALRTKRTYKDEFSHAEAVDIITKGSGGHFDPDLVGVFLRVAGDFRRISQDLADRPAV